MDFALGLGNPNPDLSDSVYPAGVHLKEETLLIGDQVVKKSDQDLGKIEEILLHVPGRI